MPPVTIPIAVPPKRTTLPKTPISPMASPRLRTANRSSVRPSGSNSTPRLPSARLVEPLVEIVAPFENLGQERAEGVDLGIQYQLLTSFGRFTSLTDVTYLESWRKFAAAAGNAAVPPQRNPVQVVASEMTYQQKTGVLVYTGNVRVDQQGKTLSCQKMQVDLDEKRQAKSMVCTGDARINDPQVGRTVTGQRAVYHVAAKQVEVFGDPVTMKDKDGNQIRGKRAVYAMDTGKVEVKGVDPNAPAATPAPTPAPAVIPAKTPAKTPAPAPAHPGSGG